MARLRIERDAVKIYIVSGDGARQRNLPSDRRPRRRKPQYFNDR